jgi:hypothetical protein
MKPEMDSMPLRPFRHTFVFISWNYKYEHGEPSGSPSRQERWDLMLIRGAGTFFALELLSNPALIVVLW